MKSDFSSSKERLCALIISDKRKLCGARAMSESARDGISNEPFACFTISVSVAGIQAIQLPTSSTFLMLSVIVSSVISGRTPSWMRTVVFSLLHSDFEHMPLQHIVLCR